MLEKLEMLEQLELEKLKRLKRLERFETTTRKYKEIKKSVEHYLLNFGTTFGP